MVVLVELAESFIRENNKSCLFFSLLSCSWLMYYTFITAKQTGLWYYLLVTYKIVKGMSGSTGTCMCFMHVQNVYYQPVNAKCSYSFTTLQLLLYNKQQVCITSTD